MDMQTMDMQTMLYKLASTGDSTLPVALYTNCRPDSESKIAILGVLTIRDGSSQSSNVVNACFRYKEIMNTGTYAFRQTA